MAEQSVFISYAADTKPLAEELTLVLQRAGIDAWADFIDLKPGQLRVDEIEKALDRAHSFVILVSPNSQATHWLEAEWRAALTRAWADSEKVIVPVVVGASEPPPFLRNWVPLRVDPGRGGTNWTSEVIEAIRRERDRAVRGLSDRDLRERQERLDQIANAAKNLRRNEPGRGQ